MDSNLTSDDIATSLGLTDESYIRMVAETRELKALEGKKFFLAPHLITAFHEREARKSKLAALKMLPEKQAERLLIELCHFHLPQLVKAHELASDDLSIWSRTILHLGIYPNPVLDRYCRLPVEGIAFVESMYRVCATELREAQAQLDPDNPSLPFGHTSTTQTYTTANNRIVILTRLTLQAGSTQFEAASLLDVLTEFVRFVSSTMDSLSPEERREAHGLMAWCETLLELHSSGRISTIIFESHSWLSCESKVEGLNLGECESLVDGEEMMACGRCQSVRYCSVAHQKVHWRVHKKVCWEPIW